MTAASGAIAVIGDGVESAIAAALLARSLRGTGLRVTVYPASRLCPLAPAVECPPAFRAVHDALSLSEPDVMRACDGAYVIGAVFENAAGADRAIVPFGAGPPPWRGAPFRQHWFAASAQGAVARFDAFFPAAVAALKGRLYFADDDPPRFLAEVGFCLDTERYAGFMRRCAAHYGAQMSGRRVRDLADFGGCARLSFDDGAEEALLALDCRGAETGPAADAERLAAPSPRPAIAVRPRGDGYEIDRPLRAATVRVRVAPAAFSDDRDVAAPWRGPIVRIGGAFAACDPIAGPELRLAADGVTRLLPLLAGGDPGEGERAEYNRQMCAFARRLRDAQSVMRRAACGTALSTGPELVRRAEQFISRGRVVTFDYDSFSEEEWTAAFIAAGHAPTRAHVLAETVDAGARARMLNEAAQRAGALADRAPRADEALERLVGRPRERAP